MSEEEIKVHPVQKSQNRLQAKIRTEVTLRAYEVYSHVFAPQKAPIEGHCRGGFGTGELIAFLYARSFPKNEWRERVDFALRGMENI